MKTRASSTVRVAVAALLVCLLGGCATAHVVDGKPTGATRAAAQSQALDEYSGLLAEAVALISAGRPDEAIGPLQATIRHFETSAKEGTRYFCARSGAETLFYLADASLAPLQKEPVVVLGPEWAFAYHLQAYALVELARLDEAELSQKSALALSPRNAFFLSELGHIYQLQQHLAKALATYEDAESAAQTFSPEESQVAELTRALRGQGFILIEMSRLDEAETRFRAALKLDPDDKNSKHELAYIKDLRAQ